MKVTLVCLSLVALTAAAYAVPLPQDRSGYDPILEELLEDKSGNCRFLFIFLHFKIVHNLVRLCGKFSKFGLFLSILLNSKRVLKW